MAERILHGGAFPTMVTPYNKDGSVDYGAVVALTEWYHEKGCDGIFAVCQSSEIMFLSVKDRAKIAKTVKETAEKWARENNIHKLVGDVRHLNIASIAACIKNGFIITGIHYDAAFINGKWHHEYILEKILEK